MVKLSELKDDVKLISERGTIRDVEEVKVNLEWFKDEIFFTTTEHHASVDAASFIDEAFDCVYENGMYEDWDEIIKQDITEEDVQKVQAVFDDILSRGGDQNIAYYPDKEVEIDV